MTEDLNRRNDQSNNERLSSVELFYGMEKEAPPNHRSVHGILPMTLSMSTRSLLFRDLAEG